jgi:3'-phosphoadenosine 5'-phosphosulfate sulfotransferase (PAPS reductase)/FAD synthetase
VGNTYHGLQDIGQWRENVSAAYNFNVEILDADKKEDTYLVFAKLTGDFPPPNPVRLTYHFKLKDGRIAELFIG